MNILEILSEDGVSDTVHSRPSGGFPVEEEVGFVAHPHCSRTGLDSSYARAAEI